MTWLIIFILALLAASAFLFWMRLKDKRYLKKPVREALGPELKKEIQKEKKEFADHQEKFGKALEKAMKKSPQPPFDKGGGNP